MRKILLLILIVVLLILFAWSRLSIKVEVPEVDLGKKVVITLPNHNTMYTYEHYISRKDGKLIYKSDTNEMDISGSIVEYKEWK